MTVRTFVAVAVLLVMSSSGCGMPRPFGGGPGTVDQQRFNASVHDPYTDNDAGPEVVGGRPRDFQRARPETTRSRTQPVSANQNSWWSNWFGGQ